MNGKYAIRIFVYIILMYSNREIINVFIEISTRRDIRVSSLTHFANAKTKAPINCAADQCLCFHYTSKHVTAAFWICNELLYSFRTMK